MVKSSEEFEMTALHSDAVRRAGRDLTFLMF